MFFNTFIDYEPNFIIMKILYLFILLALANCNCQKNATSKELAKTILNNEACPESGICTIELLKNKSLNVKNDEFGKIYYNLEENDTKNVVRYTFEKDKDSTLQDSGYREEIIFEINTNLNELTLSGKKLQETKMLFGRFCYCKGATGYYKIENGTLLLKKEKENISLDLDFKITEVPQIVTKINRIIK